MADLEIIFMDAGQGDCTLIAYPDGTLTLIDCGSTKSGDEAFAQILVLLNRYLPNNKNTIDTLVLTHPDEDHYNKIQQLLAGKNSPKPNVLHVYFAGTTDLYENQKDKNFTSTWLESMVEAELGGPPDNSFSTTPDSLLSRAGVNVTILASNCTGTPGARTGAKKNTNSIVLMVEYQGTKLFLMGDAFVETEQFILDNLDDNMESGLVSKGTGDAVLKMGHHGSDTSSGVPWVKAITPTILVVSSGTKRFSRRGMPTADKIDTTVANTKLNPDTGINQTYVVFDLANRNVDGKDFIVRAATTTGIWTTCFNVQWQNDRWAEAGQTWYFGVTPSKTNKDLRWYGYTGYEEAQDVPDDPT